MTSDTSAKTSTPLGFAQHDHETCVSESLEEAEKWCLRNGLQLTPTRRKVLEVLLQEHRALGAYKILDKLREANLSSQPTIAYRALDFLVSNGFVHKIERLNAFIACVHPGETHAPAFMICRLCDSVAETHSSPAKGILGETARSIGFQIERTVVEAEGICPKCSDVANV